MFKEQKTSPSRYYTHWKHIVVVCYEIIIWTGAVRTNYSHRIKYLCTFRNIIIIDPAVLMSCTKKKKNLSHF